MSKVFKLGLTSNNNKEIEEVKFIEKAESLVF